VPDLYLEAHRSNPQDFEIYLDIAGIVPPNAELFARFGEQLAAMDKLEQAIFFLYLTAHLRPHDGENWMKLADALSVSGDTKSAEICRSRANPTY
jgi:Flp pilus assembly protein TadD